jgi:hypothetical protein
MALPKNLDIDMKAFDDLRELIPEMGNVELVVGILAERYGAEIVEGTDITYAQLAQILEFGSPSNNIPERPAFRETFADRAVQRAAAKTIAEKVKVVANTGSKRIKQLDSVWSAVGWLLVNAVKERIRAGVEPELSERTLANRRREGRAGTTPLYDTKHLINSISWSTRSR